MKNIYYVNGNKKRFADNRLGLPLFKGTALLMALCLFSVLFFSGCISKNTDNFESGIYEKSAVLTVCYIDVGQGDCTFVQLPNGRSLLIDAANPGDAQGIVKYIKELGCKRLDYVVATHPHSDHIGGMANVISAFDTGVIYLPEISHTSEAFNSLADIISAKNIRAVPAKSGVKILSEKNLDVSVLAPVKDSYTDLNDYSAVVKIIYGKTSFLFMGDAGRPAVNDLLASDSDVKANVLKCGHHGSAESSEFRFVKAVSPQYAVISCGKGNIYGHPHRETLNALNSVGADILRTDTDGTVVITSDGSSVSCNKKPLFEKENSPLPNEKETAKDNSVYITKHGNRYHLRDCSSIGGDSFPLSRADAEKMGYTACKRCNP